MSTLPRQSGATPRFHVSLSTRSVFAVPDGAGVGIECRSGSVWVTVDRDARDIVLAPGERFQSAEHRRVLVSALESSCITVSDAQPAAIPLAKRAGARSPWRLLPHGLSPA
ncbi:MULTISPECIES: DUF2917 domain-containing protein [Variovorax]|uniref:DUF2917 domain-containing protein n=1 Tax=Variovorax TaxID=34072 RepID=UPI00086CB0F8|nr:MULTISPECIES: DUF2917 domain-containing protein [Variovorax]MBN8755382.1 DUF2917 domain-containing protein [Variovorax sp.]ODU14156.1 MAG: hypothetical protein ABS94_23825 [Variovorax sp. SCN 67-85]ODV22858.1 MAG: hypothetical protein ABT25_20430 [Variovorax sp. SCN 67-20]OJZ12635.1 MAG: hypothetical protein BGP22_31480 [Variovorax sp. 67-131]UKI09236.1 DUF2917 domain-containing protein [Variovorax paradoxus]|eukprot:gene8108-biopygen6862